MIKRRHLPILFLLVGLLLVSLVACGQTQSVEPDAQEETAVSEAEQEENVTVDTTETESTQETQTEESEETDSMTENIVTIAYPGDFPSLDPAYMLSGDTNVGFNTYETLTRWSPKDGITPVLATSWESNDEASQWTFHLRENVTFHDGTAFTAEDVKASLDRNIEIGMVAYDFIGVDSITVIDDLTVQFNTSEPRNVPLILTAQYGMFIYSEEAAGQETEWFAQAIDAGTGPYTIENYDPGANMVLNQFPDYWGGWEEGQFTKVVFNFVEDPTVRDQMIRSGDADLTAEIPFDSIESLESDGEITLLPVLPLAHLVAGFDLDNPPLDNLQVRQALASSFPYADVHQGIFRGFGAQGGAGFGPSILWEEPDDFPRYTKDLDKAAELLKEAGYEDGFELTLGLSSGVKETLDAANLWQAELAKIGVTLNIRQLASGAFWDYAYNTESTEHHILMVQASGDVPSPYAWLICYTSSELGWLPFIGYNNPDFDQLVFDAWAAEVTDPDGAVQLWQQAQQILNEDATSIFAVDYPIVFAHRNDIAGFEPNPAYSDIIFAYELSVK